MASKRQREEMEKLFQKVLNNRPEILEQQKTAVILSHMASTLTIVMDWMIPRLGVGKEECEELMDYFLCQLAEIGKVGWSTFFDDVDKLIVEDIGFSPDQYIKEHLKEVKE